MAKKEAEKGTATATAVAGTDAPEGKGKGQGRAVVLPNGQLRIDFIRDAYYKEGLARGDIRKAVNALYPEGSDGMITYQIVFAATKIGEKGNAASDPRLAVKEAAPAATPAA